MSNTKTSSETLNEALTHLNVAARERRGELQTLIAEKYADLGSAFGGVAHASASWVKEQGREIGDTSKLAAKTVNHSVRMHPWYYVGGAAASGLLVGLLVGRLNAKPASV